MVAFRSGYKKVDNAEEVEMGRIGGNENSILDSFDSYEADTLDGERSDEEAKSNVPAERLNEEEDTRLLDQNGLESSKVNEIDRQIHSSIVREGNSSQNDLEVYETPKNSEVNLEMHADDTEENVDEQNEDTESQTEFRKPNLKDRCIRFLLHLLPVKQTYERINNGITTGRMQSNQPGRFIGLGTDGVFRNLMAKPARESQITPQEVSPPSYEEAAADATPEYWESSVFSPMYDEEVFVEGLPVGNIANFIWNILVSSAFQFVGFVLCYLLHTSHASKQGSRAGLGITIIFYGCQLLPSNRGSVDKVPSRIEPQDPNGINDSGALSIVSDHVDTYKSGLKSLQGSITDELQTPYFAYGVIAFGIFIIIKALIDYYRVKQTEKIILSPPAQQNNVTNSITELVQEAV